VQFLYWRYSLFLGALTFLCNCGEGGKNTIALVREMDMPTIVTLGGVQVPMLELGWEFQFLLPISGTPIGSGIPIPFSIPMIPVGFFFEFRC
jgi:hypothetical protein